MSRLPLVVFIALTLCACLPLQACAQESGKATNPIIWADVPDPSLVRVGDVYYMSSTTMHVNPGVPIMKSTDLVNWEIVSYAYDVLADTDELALRNGEDAYGQGSWASSIRYRDGTFYVVTFSYSTGQTHIYQTDDVENGSWRSHTLPGLYHDPGLYFEDNGRVFLTYGVDDIRIIELTSDVTGIKPGGLDQILIPKASRIAGTAFYVPAEGSHLQKIDGRYYVSLISWPRGGMRSQLVYRADSLTGPYEGRIVLQDGGVAQGAYIDTPDGDWYAFLFQDNGAVGRTPWLIPVHWEDGWPVLGEDGKAPLELDLPRAAGLDPGIVASDEFEYGDGESLALVWQWNHNPVDSLWSLTDRPGFIRIVNGRIDSTFLETQNTLTQRTYGPTSSAQVAVEMEKMKDGDRAGLGALQAHYGFVGVRVGGTSRYVIRVDGSPDGEEENAAIPIDQDRVYLRIDADFRDRVDLARFYYSFDGQTWNEVGDALQMRYTLPHFMGYRFALFNYATREPGGFADFDFYRTSPELIGTRVDE